MADIQLLHAKEIDKIISSLSTDTPEIQAPRECLKSSISNKAHKKDHIGKRIVYTVSFKWEEKQPRWVDKLTAARAQDLLEKLKPLQDHCGGETRGERTDKEENCPTYKTWVTNRFKTVIAQEFGAEAPEYWGQTITELLKEDDEARLRAKQCELSGAPSC